MRILISLFFIFLTATVLKAQNPRFSMFDASPLVVNPAYAGKINGSVRAGTHFGVHLSDSAEIRHLNTYVDFRTSVKGDKRTNHLGIGLNFYTYGFNSQSPVIANFPSLSLAYHMGLGKTGKHFLGIGAQVAYASARLDETKGLYDKELSGGGFRYVPTANRRNTTARNSYWDASGGVYYQFKGEDVEFETGLSMYHMFYPKNDIYKTDQETRLRHRGVMNMRMQMKLSKKRSIAFQSMYWADGLYWRSRVYDSDNLVAFWTGVEILNSKAENGFSVDYGIYSRTFRTFMPYLSLHFNKVLNFRMSYEWPFNSTAFESNRAKRGEAALIFNFSKK